MFVVPVGVCVFMATVAEPCMGVIEPVKICPCGLTPARIVVEFSHV